MYIVYRSHSIYDLSVWDKLCFVWNYAVEDFKDMVVKFNISNICNISKIISKISKFCACVLRIVLVART